MKKIISLALLLCLALSIFSGCNNETQTGTGDDGDRITVTIGLPQNMMVQDYNTNAFTLWLEETTGHNIEFQYFATAASDYRSQLSTMVAGGEKLPDMLWDFSLAADLYREYGEDGYFLRLNDYFEDEEKSKVFWDRVEAMYPDDFKTYVKDHLAEMSTGDIWAMPRIECTSVDTIDSLAFINQEWLKKLNLEMPDSPESLYNVLKAFVTQDPNGNSKADEIGLIGLDVTSGKGQGVGWLINMFVNVSEKVWWNVDENGKLYLPHTTDEYREALIYINKLVKEGLIPDSVWSMTINDIKALVSPADGVNRVGVWIGHPSLTLVEGNTAFYEYAALPVFGYPVIVQNTFEKKAFITTDCENPDAAWDIYMAMCSEEGSTRMRYGAKGVDWVDADPGTTSFTGAPAKIKVLNQTAFGAQGNTCWNKTSACIIIDAENESVQLDENTDEWTKKKLGMMGDYYKAWYAAVETTEVHTAPLLVYTEEQSELTETERTDCRNWLTSMRSFFCCGIGGNDPNDDADWQAYLNGLESRGFETWRSQAQEIYDATKG